MSVNARGPAAGRAPRNARFAGSAGEASTPPAGAARRRLHRRRCSRRPGAPASASSRRSRSRAARISPIQAKTAMASMSMMIFRIVNTSTPPARPRFDHQPAASVTDRHVDVRDGEDLHHQDQERAQDGQEPHVVPIDADAAQWTEVHRVPREEGVDEVQTARRDQDLARGGHLRHVESRTLLRHSVAPFGGFATLDGLRDCSPGLRRVNQRSAWCHPVPSRPWPPSRARPPSKTRRPRRPPG